MGGDYSVFARRYLLNHRYFLFLRLIICLNSASNQTQMVHEKKKCRQKKSKKSQPKIKILIKIGEPYMSLDKYRNTVNSILLIIN